ncbi:MAG: hypothetical protein CJD30_06130 [Sulfuricurvum sp. PD_MW2]|uniref:hypothetical protein n=1 Tax=Sulfuricurvum sp. PD_MW2 TaxID=2027917 RepID=UPI000C0661F3|nr:hypothetical protein [Sulfuricurvum sp. PD_MW2]PHM17474.1 MAG: hypothetical protein CJD30_06130 [Sulfuricurvum sp. PD_MW2]
MFNISFYNEVSPITMYDPLAKVLGAAEEGIFTYTYADAVKLAGHSCPTVAGTYLMLKKALNLLYPDTHPIRGEIKIYFQGNLGEGVVGVMSNIATLITGATDNSGFHGLSGKYDRRRLVVYGSDMRGEMAIERMDTGAKIELSYNPKIVPSDSKMAEWLGMILSEKATLEIERSFQEAWQKRVKSILIDYAEHPGLIITH